MGKELKQCQCGATEYLPQIEVTWFKGKGWVALNDVDNVEIQVFSIRCPYCGYRPGWWETKAEAIEAWNTRPGEKALQKELDVANNIIAGVKFIEAGKELVRLRAELARKEEEIKVLEEWAEAERHLRMEQSDADPKRYNELAKPVCVARSKLMQIRQGNKLRAHCEGKPVINNEDEISMPGMAED